MNFNSTHFVLYLVMVALVAQTVSFVPTGTVRPTVLERTVSSFSRSTQRIFESTDSDEPQVIMEIEDLSMSQIAEMIEVTFIQSCMVSTV
jgi:hypothetical protein